MIAELHEIIKKLSVLPAGCSDLSVNPHVGGVKRRRTSSQPRKVRDSSACPRVKKKQDDRVTEDREEASEERGLYWRPWLSSPERSGNLTAGGGRC